MAALKLDAFITGGLLLLWSGVACSQTPKTAKATLVNAQGERMGAAALEETDSGVKITLEVSGLPPGRHAFHLHAAGRCEPPDFKSAGGHFNPFGKKHGVKSPEGAHAGDLPNIEVGPDGTGKGEVITKQVTLGPGPNSLFQPEGTSLVIHADPDDDVTDPAGNAGARIACGVIEAVPRAKK
jgi:Cu-Zn family superoxide dismutase